MWVWRPPHGWSLSRVKADLQELIACSDELKCGFRMLWTQYKELADQGRTMEARPMPSPDSHSPSPGPDKGARTPPEVIATQQQLTKLARRILAVAHPLLDDGAIRHPLLAERARAMLGSGALLTGGHGVERTLELLDAGEVLPTGSRALAILLSDVAQLYVDHVDDVERELSEDAASSSLYQGNGKDAPRAQSEYGGAASGSRAAPLLPGEGFRRTHNGDQAVRSSTQDSMQPGTDPERWRNARIDITSTNLSMTRLFGAGRSRIERDVADR